MLCFKLSSVCFPDEISERLNSSSACGHPQHCIAWMRIEKLFASGHQEHFVDRRQRSKEPMMRFVIVLQIVNCHTKISD